MDNTLPEPTAELRRSPTTLLNPEQFASQQLSRSLKLRISARVELYRWKYRVAARPALKRAVDFSGALIGLMILSPLLLLTAALIKLESKGPVFFSQIRVGKRGMPFSMLKFRSMGVTAEADKSKLMAENESEDGVLFKMKQDPRITRVGKIIRRFSIDELPQLFNILKGDMAIVGPRPALPQEVDQYDARARKRLQTKPGLTCIWQISGRSDIPFSQQVELDLDYLVNKNVGKDVEIIAKTLPAVISGKGAY